jgi:predicted DNA-binding transcriptional regulator AlpA
MAHVSSLQDGDRGHPGDRALDDGEICERFGISKPTLNRWREKHKFPKPDFFVGPRPFTWESQTLEWTRKQPSVSPIAKRVVPTRG